MIWSFITIIGLIQSRFSRPDFIPAPLEDLRHTKRAKTIESGYAAVEKSGSSSFSGCERRQKDDIYHLIPDLDQSHVERVIESNKNGPYFWEDSLFKGNTHAGWEAADQQKRESSQSSIMERVDIIRKECAVLKRNLESHQELRLLTNHDSPRSAYETLEDFLDRISDILVVFFYPEKHENAENMRTSQPPYEGFWEFLVSDVNATVDQLEDILWDFQARDYFSEEKSFHILMTQVFSIHNFFIKNNLISEQVLEGLIRKTYIKEFIEKDIINMLSKESLLGLDFHECLLKTQSTEYLVFVFKLLQEDFFRNVEYEVLKFHIKSLRGFENQMSPIIYKVTNKFYGGRFEKADGRNARSRKKLIKEIIDHFDKLGYDFDFFRQDITVGILYHMICFLLKYYPELFESCLEDELHSHSFSIKMKITDSALRWLRSSREIQFIGTQGFWTSEPSFTQSEYQIPLNQVKNWKPSIQNEVDYFRNRFGCYISKDFDSWLRVFKYYSLRRSQPETIVYKNGQTIHGYTSELLESFGTNFKLRKQDKGYINSLKGKTEYPPMISKAFLSDLYSWLQRLHLLADIQRENKRIWLQIMQSIPSKNEPAIADNIQKWLNKSAFIRAIIREIRENTNEARINWKIFEENMDLLNKSIVLSMHSGQDEMIHYSSAEARKSIPQKNDIKVSPTNEPQDSSTPGIDTQNREGLMIPNIQIPESYFLHESNWP